MVTCVSLAAGDDSQVMSCPNNVIHIWTVSLRIDKETRRRLWTSLSQEERRKAASFRYPSARHRYIAGRGNLRCILAKYTSQNPNQISISKSIYGKPYLPGSHYKFNLSHSRNLCAYAIAAHSEVGVDVEYVPPAGCCDDIAQYVFSPKEASAFERVSKNRKDRLFYLCWVAKEAYVKGLGAGLLIPFPSFTTPLPFSSARKALWPTEDIHRQGWLIQHLRIRRNYVAALAVKTRGDVVICSFKGVNKY